MKIENLKIDIYADGADLENIKTLNEKNFISGFTTNPTLMRNSGVKDYENFAKSFLQIVKDKPISFEVFADDFDEMYNQALTINSWGDNVYIKIPITNTKGESSVELIKRLNQKGVKCNVTAVFKFEQIQKLYDDSDLDQTLIISVFAGRIADTGIDPMPIMKNFANKFLNKKNFKLLWASPREILNIVHAQSSSCDIITVPHDLLGKLKNFGKDLEQFSIETVKMFYEDAVKSNYNIKI